MMLTVYPKNFTIPHGFLMEQIPVGPVEFGDGPFYPNRVHRMRVGT